MLDTNDLKRLMSELSNERPLFHSEADFQHALAIKLLPKDYFIRLERRIFVNNDDFYVDVYMVDKNENQNIAIELKYKTALLELHTDDEEFLLKDQGANDLGRYHLREDVFWLEKLKKDNLIAKGFSIFLTNDQKYWNDTGHKTKDQAFKIHEGKIHKDADWSSNEAKWTGKHHRLELNKEYRGEWIGYSDLGIEKNGTFNYLLIEI